jgi:hypothetical protein
MHEVISPPFGHPQSIFVFSFDEREEDAESEQGREPCAEVIGRWLGLEGYANDNNQKTCCQSTALKDGLPILRFLVPQGPSCWIFAVQKVYLYAHFWLLYYLYIRISCQESQGLG